MALNEKQKRFADEYLVDLNATQAAMRAGYSARSAYSQGHRLLQYPEVKGYISAQQEKLREKLEFTREMVIGEIAKIAFGDIRGVLDWSEGGITLVPSSRIPDDVAASISEVKAMSSGISVKQYDKLRALDLMSKILGFYEDQKEKDEAMPLLVDEP